MDSEEGRHKIDLCVLRTSRTLPIGDAPTATLVGDRKRGRIGHDRSSTIARDYCNVRCWPGSAPGDPSQDNTNAAPDFNFVSTTTATTANDTSTAQQISGFGGTDGFEIVASANAPALNATPATAVSTFDLTFHFTGSSPFILNGNWVAIFGEYDISLTRGATTLYRSTTTTPFSDFASNFILTLPEGDYRFFASVWATNGPGVDPTYTINLAVRVPASGPVAFLGLPLAGALLRRRR